MKKKLLIYSTLLFTLLGVVLGFTSINDNPKKGTTPESSRNSVTKTLDLKKSNLLERDNNGGGYQITGLPYYTDNFDGANDTTALKSRGYKVYYRGTGPQGVLATWIQGVPTNFVSFNGPTNGYVAGHYNSVTGTNKIDNWLVLPKKTIAAGDSLVFYSRSPTASTFPDSIRVMYSAAGDSVPEATWTEISRFKVTTSGSWERRTFGAPVAGANARYAIRYCVVNGGPSGSNSDFIGVDALTIETTPLANDMATLTIDSVFNYALPVDVIAPRATFKNAGTAAQTSVPVTYKVTGPVSYTSSKVISSIAANGVSQVVFDSTFNPNVEGTYNITVYCSLGSDGYRSNDTLRTSFFVVQPNYGGGGAGTGGYYFANSTPNAAPAPSHPSYCWMDTTGSTTIVSNNIPSIAASSGDLDDGYWLLAGVTGTSRIKFMGTLYSDVYIGTNGIIAFASYDPGTGNWYPPASGLPGGTVRPAIYPAWNDLKWDNTDQPINRLSYKVDGANNRIIVTYDRAPLYGGLSTEWETFQVVIDLVPNSGASPNSNFTISHSNSTTVISIPYLVGIQDATGANYLQYTFINSAGDVISPGPLFDTTAGGGVTIAFGPNASSLNGPCSKVLSLKTNYEACPSPTMISVLLRNSTSPYGIVDSVVATGGANTVYPVNFNTAANGVPYYIVVRSINSIETWSATPVSFSGGTASYDFTTSLSQAYGSNQKLSGGIPSIYQGDANQDGFVDGTDVVTYTYANVVAGTSNPSTDYNCDGFTDLTDLILDYNNSVVFIQKQRP